MLQTIDRTSAIQNVVELLCRRVDLSDAQRVLADERYEAVGDWLKNPRSPLARHYIRIFPQGSLRLGTAVRPIGQDEFDLDIVILLSLDPRRLTDALSVLKEVYEWMRSSPIYRDMVTLEDRCVRVHYAGDFHLDLVPAFYDPDLGEPYLLIVDKDSPGHTKRTNPIGYARWFADRESIVKRAFAEVEIEPLPADNSLTPKSVLRREVQLIKRWRDVRFKNDKALAPPSVLLTTLVGERYHGEGSVIEAVSNGLERIESFVLDATEPPGIMNPAHSMECHSDLWLAKPDGFDAFRSRVPEFRAGWAKLVQAVGLDEITDALSELFDEELAKNAVTDHTKRFQAARELGTAGVRRGSPTLAIVPGPLVIPTRKHTFHGDGE